MPVWSASLRRLRAALDAITERLPLDPLKRHLQSISRAGARLLTPLFELLDTTTRRLLVRPAASHDRRALPVLCFGDSITEGYHGVWIHPDFSPSTNEGGNEIANVRLRPYSVRLGHHLANDASDGAEGYRAALRYASVRAYSGWSAEELLPALRAALRERPWRAACILAGSNDVILAGEDAATVLRRVARLHEACDTAGVPVVVMTLPDADLAHHGMVPAEAADSRRKVLAQVAEGLTAVCRSKNPQRRCLSDVRDALPLSAELFDDCMHPSPAGSDRIADTVYSTLHHHGL